MHNKNKQAEKALSMWESWSRARRGVPVYDPWLDEYQDDLAARQDSTILDLGCGIGANTAYLIERNYRVLWADYSLAALSSIRAYIPKSETTYVDMSRPLPFRDHNFDVIVADISLHYFDTTETVALMKEIRRILKPGGVLLARVSSINDTHYGAGSGRELEPRFYDHGSYAQRYFNEADIDRFFGLIGNYTFQETAMTRKEAYYSLPKMLYQIRVER